MLCAIRVIMNMDGVTDIETEATCLKNHVRRYRNKTDSEDAVSDGLCAREYDFLCTNAVTIIAAFNTAVAIHGTTRPFVPTVSRASMTFEKWNAVLEPHLGLAIMLVLVACHDVFIISINPQSSEAIARWVHVAVAYITFQ